MDRISIQVINRSDLPLPSYANLQDAGMDLRACLEAPVILEPFVRQLIPTGLSIALPAGYEGQVRPRSGLALRHGITVLNSPGTVDAGYRGEIKTLLINLSEVPFTLHHGDRIAQLVVAPYTRATWEVVTTLPPTARGVGGYGSTGVS